MRNIYKFLFLSLLNAAALNATAQSWGFGQPGNWAADVAIAADGNVWAVGLAGDDPGMLDVTGNYVVKLSADGEKLWGETPAGLPWASATAYSVMPTADGGAVIYCVNDLGLPAAYKLDAEGTLLWNTDGMWTGDYYIYGGIAAQLNDGRIIIGGLGYVGFFGTIENKFYELDASGNLLSSFTAAVDTTDWGFGYWNYKETGLIATTDGGFAYSSGNDVNRVILKYNSDLDIEWTGNYPWISDWEYGYQNSLKQTSDGGYLFSGSGNDPAAMTYVGVVRKIASDGSLEWAHTYNHGYDYEEGSWAVELGDNYIIWTQDGGDNSTNGWVVDNMGTEIGSEFIPIINCNWGFPETGMEVMDVENAPDGGYILAGRQYLEDCSQRFTLIKSNPDGSFDPCIFNCVWPGDANNDGLADASDLFEIGINYGATGFSREDMGIDWSAKLSRAWMEPDTLYWYVFNDLKWTDCNGDGTINDDDTAAVALNFGLDHPINDLKTTAGDVPLFFEPTEDVLHIGLNTIPIILGDELNSVDEIYGLSFTIELSGSENIDINSLKVNFNDSWLSTADTRLSISKTNPDELRVYAGVVRKDRANVAGHGEIGTLSIVVIDNITGKTESEDATLSFVEAKAIKLNREELSVETSGITFPVESSESTYDPIANGINIYPNPAGDILFIDNVAGISIDMLEISDLAGRIIYSGNLSGSNVIDLSKIEAGNYLIKVISGEKIITEKLTVL